MSTSIRPSFQLTLLCSACLVAALAWLHPLPSLGNDPSSKDLDVVLANPNDLLMQARVIPAIHNGVPQGLKIFSIRPGSLYSLLGLQNGDVLLRINGLSLGSVERGLEAFQTLRDASRIELEVDRNGQLMRLTYSLR